MAINTTSTLSELVKTAYDQAVEFGFRPELRFANFAETKKWDMQEAPVPGNAVVFTIFDQLTAASGALPEDSDPGSQSLSTTQKTVTMYEYGKLVQTTNKLRLTSYVDMDLAVAKVVGENMGLTVDILARKVFNSMTASDNISYVNSNVYATGVTSSDYLGAEDFRTAFNKLARNNVKTFEGGFFGAILHPDVIKDVKESSDAGGWRVPKEYCDPEEIYSGEIGAFEGFRVLGSTNALLQISGASGSVDLYSNYFIGYQAAGCAQGEKPELKITGPYDAFERLLNIGWYGIFGYGPLRIESLHTFFSASSRVK